MLKVAIYTLGCKVNQADSQSIQELFSVRGYEIVSADKPADVYIINTCVVTNVGQQKSRQNIRRIIRNNPDAIIVVTGCYPQTASEEVAQIDGVHLIVGNQDRAGIVDLVQEFIANRSRKNIVTDIKAAVAFEQLPSGINTDKTRAFLKIQEGCNQFCSYCIIPYARGRLRSRSLEDITEQVRALTKQGFKEVVLLGIHLGAYGKDLDGQITLADALEAALSVADIQRVRLGSLECVELDDKLLSLMASDSRVAGHLHLPLQSGSDKVLKRMNRPYSQASFKALVDKARAKLPDIAITTDIIVGFPGESAEDFMLSMQFAEEIGFADIHIFPYSKRKNTPAADFAEQIPRTIKDERAKALNELRDNLNQKFLENNVNKSQAVLIEEGRQGMYCGYSSNYMRVYVQSEEDITNKLINVLPKQLFKDGVYGIPN